jgi:hypothetical protein
VLVWLPFRREGSHGEATDGEWYDVLIKDGRSSFDVVKYDFLRAGGAVFGDMRASDGFVFTDTEGNRFQGPLTAVLAIRSNG